MTEDALSPFETFLSTTEEAVNETQRREAFIILAATGFGDSTLATDMALGAEYRMQFQNSGLIRRGFVDSFYENLIIEFKHDLDADRTDALQKLQNYTAGAWKEDGSTERHYVAVATDGLRWEVYSPTTSQAIDDLDARDVELNKVESWPRDTAEATPESLKAFLNRLFFRKSLVKPTVGNFAADFGIGSSAFVQGSDLLLRKLNELTDDPQLEVLRKAWSDSLQLAYGSVDTDDVLFAKHTYLATLARLLVFVSWERRSIDPSELDDVLDGKYFVDRNISNLVEDDFFKWTQIGSAVDDRTIWIALSRQLAGYDLGLIQEDILKPLYEQLVDPDARRLLGEYYTPDWLAQLVTEELLKTWDWTDGLPAVLDPACGSGTFLRSVIEEIRAKSDTSEVELIDRLLGRVMGIDVHPLAVTISRATYLIAIDDLTVHLTSPVTIPVFLANSLVLPPSSGTLFGEVTLYVGEREFAVPESFAVDEAVYDSSIDDVVAVAKAYGDPDTDIRDASASLIARLGDRLSILSEGTLEATLGSMAEHLALLIRERTDSLYGFLLKNHYRPGLLRHQFDYVIGNPPWLTVSAIETASYKKLVIDLATRSRVAARSAGEQSHTELAILFIPHALKEYLREGDSQDPRIAFVLPRSVFTASHHRFLREGKYVPSPGKPGTVFDVVGIWDLLDVKPLFNIPACVLWIADRQPQPSSKKPGKSFSGRLPSRSATWDEAKPHLRSQSSDFELAFLGKRSAWRPVNPNSAMTVEEWLEYRPNPYVSKFRQGAVLYPQTLMIVKSKSDPAKSTGSIRVFTDPAASRDAKKLPRTKVNHLVEPSSVFYTFAGEHLLPYTASSEPWMVLLPTTQNPRDPEFRPQTPDELRKDGKVQTASWLQWANKRWARVRKKGDRTPLWERIDHLGQFSGQSQRDRYLVIYTAAAKRPVACVVDTQALDLPLIVRDRTYWMSTRLRAEADFVAAFLNSTYAADRILDWMNRGLFGPRDINKRVLDVPWPEFDPEDSEHVQLAKIGRRLAAQAEAAETKVDEKTTARRRRAIRERLSEDLALEVEEHVARISASFGLIVDEPGGSPTES